MAPFGRTWPSLPGHADCHRSTPARFLKIAISAKSVDRNVSELRPFMVLLTITAGQADLRDNMLACMMILSLFQCWMRNWTVTPAVQHGQLGLGFAFGSGK